MWSRNWIEIAKNSTQQRGKVSDFPPMTRVAKKINHVFFTLPRSREAHVYDTEHKHSSALEYAHFV